MTRRILITALAVLLPIFMIVMSVSPAAALVIAPSNETQNQTEAFVLDYMTNWQDDLIVSEYQFMGTLVLQIYYIVPSMDAVDFNAFSSDFWSLLSEPDLMHERVFLDIVNESGKRLESYDIEPDTLDMERAVFGENTDTTDIPDLSNAVTVGFSEPFGLGDADLVIKSMDLLEDDYGPYILLTFDFTNNSDSASSAFMMVDYYAEQDGITLERHYTLDDVDTTYTDIEPGTLMENCLVGFYLTNETSPVTFIFEEFLGEDVAAFSVEIGGVG